MLGARTLLGAPGLTTRSKKLLVTASFPKNLGAKSLVRLVGALLQRSSPRPEGSSLKKCELFCIQLLEA